MDKPKKGLALLLGPEDEDDSLGGDAAVMAAQGVLDAVAADDAEELAEALRTFVDAVRAEG